MDITQIITADKFKAMFGSTTAYESFLKVAEKYALNTKQRIAHFLAQAGHESGGLSIFQENLNYSRDGLLKVFGKYFTPDQATTYARKPEYIANRVYANRLGNGNEKSGDGWKFRGRGAIQVTGKDNYAALTRATGIDFLGSPDMLAHTDYALMSAGWYWDRNKLNALADKNDLFGISKAVNNPSAKTTAGVNGYEDRQYRYNKYIKILG